MRLFRLRRIVFTLLTLVIIVLLNYFAIINETPTIVTLAITVIGLPAASMLLDIALGKRPGIVVFIEEIFSAPNYLKILLKKVEASWLVQFLEPTLSRSVFFVPFTTFTQEDIEKNRLPNNDENIIGITTDKEEDQVLQKAVTNSIHQVLVLGEQGVGKTILMLKILKWAVQLCAEENRWNSIPVVLNLSTWNIDKESFDSWVVNQLRVKYQLPTGIAQQIFNNKQLFLFLDGLDEAGGFESHDNTSNIIPEDRQINIYDDQKGLVPDYSPIRIEQVVSEFNKYMKGRVGLEVSKDKCIRFVMCCRTDTYKVLKEKPLAAGGIVLHKLNQNQVLTYVAKDGENGNLLELMSQGENLDIIENARIPYRLNVMLKTFKDEEYSKLEILKICRNDEELFRDYVRTRLETNAIRDYKSDENVIYWLSNLAEYTKLIGSEEFLIEELQPYMLFSGKWKRIYQFLFLTVVALFLVVAVSVPVSVALGYEWFYHSGRDAAGLDVGLTKGSELFFYSTLIMLIMTPIAFGYGSMTERAFGNSLGN